jgi:hypothetical protein
MSSPAWQTAAVSSPISSRSAVPLSVPGMTISRTSLTRAHLQPGGFGGCGDRCAQQADEVVRVGGEPGVHDQGQVLVLDPDSGIARGAGHDFRQGAPEFDDASGSRGRPQPPVLPPLDVVHAVDDDAGYGVEAADRQQRRDAAAAAEVRSYWKTCWFYPNPPITAPGIQPTPPRMAWETASMDGIVEKVELPSVNANSFARGTSMPREDAARALARIASKRRPATPRRTLAVMIAAMTGEG